MTKIKYFGIFLLCLFLIPSIVSADTLLDKKNFEMLVGLMKILMKQQKYLILIMRKK